MTEDFKNINIGRLICKGVTDADISIQRISNFFQCSEAEVEQMYKSESLNANILLKWSKLLEYDFFRIYSQHLILYAPPAGEKPEQKKSKIKSLPQFRKNIYTREIIDFIIEQIRTGEMTRNEVMERYRIPKTTLYKWISKYGNLKAW